MKVKLTRALVLLITAMLMTFLLPACKSREKLQMPQWSENVELENITFTGIDESTIPMSASDLRLLRRERQSSSGSSAEYTYTITGILSKTSREPAESFYCFDAILIDEHGNQIKVASADTRPGPFSPRSDRQLLTYGSTYQFELEILVLFSEYQPVIVEFANITEKDEEELIRITLDEAIETIGHGYSTSAYSAKRLVEFVLMHTPENVEALALLEQIAFLEAQDIQDGNEEDEVAQDTSTTSEVSSIPTPPSDPLPTVSVIEERGNTVGNIINGGGIALQGNWLYYCNVNDGNKLYKMHTDGTDNRVISDDRVWYINVMGEWVYYRNSEDGKLYRIFTDGTGRQMIANDEIHDINVVGDWIYYCNATDGCKLYKIRIDGTNRQKVTDDSVSYVNVVDGWAYYRNKDDGWKLYKIRTDGTNRQKISDDNATYINVVGDWVYYSNMTSNRSVELYKIRTDGTGRSKITGNAGQSISNVNVVDDWIYYIVLHRGNRQIEFFMIRTDGTDRQKVTEDEVNSIYVVGEWVYYVNRSDEYSLYRVQTDGTDRQRVG